MKTDILFKRARKTVMALFLCPLFITSCIGRNPFQAPEVKIESDKGGILQYNEVNAPDGVFIKRDNIFYPLLHAGMEDGSSGRGAMKVRFSSFENLIPRFIPGDTMVVVSSSNFPSPGQFSIIKMEDLGWTLGVDFFVNNSTYGNEMVSFGQDTSIYGRDVQTIRNVVRDSPGAVITEIVANDGTAIKFTSNLLNRMGFLKGLVKGGEYRINYYAGTRFNSVTLIADNRVFVPENSGNIIPVDMEPTKSSYFNIVLPHLDPGYYVLKGYGFFIVE